MLSDIKCYLPLKVNFIKGHLPKNVVFHHRSFIWGCLLSFCWYCSDSSDPTLDERNVNKMCIEKNCILRCLLISSFRYITHSLTQSVTEIIQITYRYMYLYFQSNSNSVKDKKFKILVQVTFANSVQTV